MHKPEVFTSTLGMESSLEVKIIEPPKPILYSNKSEQLQCKNWDQQIIALQNYFSEIALFTHPVKLNRCVTISSCSLFIESHLATLEANNGKRTFLPYLKRLQELKQVLTAKSN